MRLSWRQNERAWRHGREGAWDWFVGSCGFAGGGPSWAAEPDPSKAADECRGRRVLASSPQVVLREQPNDEAPASLTSVAGIWLDVTRSEGEWLDTDLGWLRAADAVRAEQA